MTLEPAKVDASVAVEAGVSPDARRDNACDGRTDEHRTTVEPDLLVVRNVEEDVDAVGRSRDEDEHYPDDHPNADAGSPWVVARALEQIVERPVPRQLSLEPRP